MIDLTDFHCHILPGIDDGSASPEESLQLLQLEAQQHVHTVVATPHFYAHRDQPDAFLRRRERSLLQLTEALHDITGLPQIVCGAEVAWFPGMGSCDTLQQLAIAGTRTILVEMPMSLWTPAMYRELEDIRAKQGLIPIVAHVDRYIRPLKTHGIPRTLASMPVLVQANGSFFLHRSTASMALRMLNQGNIHLLGSDCHNLDTRRPNLGKAAQRISEKLGESALERICETENRILSRE